MRLKEFGINILLTFIVIIIFFIFLEVGLRVVDHFRSGDLKKLDKIIWENEYKFYEYDPILGWKNKAGAEGVFRTSNTKTHISINSKGLRDIEHDYIGDGRFRILVLGDSFVWGYGSEQDKRFTEYLQTLLGDRAEVINAGVSGYGTDQELLYFKSEGFKYSPDLVILAFGTADATNENITGVHNTYPKPYFTLDEGRLTLQNVPVPIRACDWEKRYEFKTTEYISLNKRIRKFLRKRFKTYGLVSDGIKSIRRSIRDAIKDNPKVFNYMLQKRAKRGDSVFGLTEEIVKELDKSVSSNDARLIVLVVPYPSHIRKLPDAIYYKMTEFCKSQDILCIDPYARFYKTYKKGEKLFFDVDAHWNDTGQRLIAEEIYDYLTKKGLIQ